MPSRRELANALRFLAIDAVQAAKSGHPGMPMGMADIAQVLFSDVLKHDPSTPNWLNRDRFVLSNGHGSMLLYGLLHLTGYDLPLEELKQFRQQGSQTPGHPEYAHTAGVEMTTGPLGQGFASAVGMALGEHLLADEFNQSGHDIVDHHTYVFLGDGCLMEGISHEAASMAGTLGLGKLVAIWDDNQISIDGEVDGWCRDDVPARFEAYGWRVIRDVDGHDFDAIQAALSEAKAMSDQPCLIATRTQIGFGSPALAGSEKSHGAPLGSDEIAATREALDWPHAPFELHEDLVAAWDGSAKGASSKAGWDAQFSAYQAQHPELAAEFKRRMAGDLPADFADQVHALFEKMAQIEKPLATRKASQAVLEALAPNMPELFGGSADLSGSNGTLWAGAKVLKPTQATGRYMQYGVREFGMFAMINGLALHGGLIPYAGTFLVFADYGRSAMRLAAMMKQKVVYVLTHDSIGLGEDGPTHQPIEHLSMLRATPGLETWRPADALETAVAWAEALDHQGPTCLALSRQGLPSLGCAANQSEQIAQGGYVVRDFGDDLQIVLMATGSEVQLALEAAAVLHAEGVHVRVVSMPCLDRFLALDQAAQEVVIPSEISARLAIEAASSQSWYRLVGRMGDVMGIDTFGASAPADQLFEKFGFTVEQTVARARALVAAK